MDQRKFSYVIIAIAVVILIGGLWTYSGDSDYQKGTRLYEIKESGKLIVGTEAEYPPLEFYNEYGEFVGFEVDLANEIAKGLGVELEFDIMDWDNLFDAVKTRKIDLSIASTTITAKRAEEMRFSTPYFNAGQTIVALKSNQEVNGIDDLRDKKIGVESKTTGQDALNELGIDPVPYENSAEEPFIKKSLRELENKNIDAIVMDYIGAVNMVQENPSLKIVGEPFTQEFYGIVTHLENEALMSEVDKILTELKQSGKLKELENKWLA